ncbi:MAG: hypothetical protein COU63_04505 [Candidatus Pacebacteria bacterium CG10_big_fil_rev_8_21_14_0_10_36_11]|nr:DNA repair protein RadC [Candidatus Pacearchaeota archaeon]OIP74029.1 MAG: hypothetical protein AUK08_02110 [Candidatus Pacebacteria bacterium CG2_30_36_39]PIR64330.1 MAG: hypothetical protein COU63_04505 [Candidatus Pacebacteria bacterium CG10_big_fil_rev_8_21_14_0_10_36_11]PJC42543.1 MAG: hypothetical protein CO040_03905 [Candidatus Pacebacteria bacterium CG_4_9_14_0_2_um_filter_36_8]
MAKQKPRLREKLKAMGLSNLTDQELCTLILGSGTKRCHVKTLAKKFLQKFPLQNLHQTPVKELTQLAGIGTAKATKLLAGVELGRRNALPPIQKILSPNQALTHLQDLRDKTKEHTVCLYLNARSELLKIETVAIGGLNYSLMEPKEILSSALTLPAAAFILAHNHPSGNANPSDADKDSSQKLLKVSEQLGIRFLDHLIIAKQTHFSFQEAGLLS